jgi:hypothetical protein
LKKLDDFIIDNLFQRVVNLIGISPFIISYYLWGITIAGECALGVVFHNFILIFVGLILIINQIQVSQLEKIKRLQANPIRYAQFGYVSRAFILFIFMTCDLPFFYLPIYKENLFVDILWLSAIYTSCCSMPPPKEIKQTIDKMVYQ